MQTDKILLVWYSRTGTTREVAMQVQQEIACDTEELVDCINRRGIVGWLRSAFDARLKHLTTLEATHHQPREYDLVIVGTPVWSGSLPPAVRTYLGAHRYQFPRLAFFSTNEGRGTKRVFDEMARICGRAPERILEARGKDIGHGLFQKRVHEFVSSLRELHTAA